MPLSPEEVLTRTTYHPPTPAQVEAYTDIRAAVTHTLQVVDAVAPESREKALALTNLEQAMFWANAAVARRT